MKNDPFFKGFIFGTIFTLVVSGVCVFYYRIVEEMRYHAAPVHSNFGEAKLPASKNNPPVAFTNPASPVKGSANAPVTIVEYADFFCGYCKKAMPTMLKIAQNYPGKVRQVFKNNPLANTPGQGSYRAHEAGVCANEQGKFWEFYEKVFTANRPDEAGLQAIAGQIGLDTKKFNDCLASGRAIRAIEADLAEGKTKNVDGTPTFFINDTELGGAYPYEKFQQIIDSYLKTGKAPSEPKPVAPQAKTEFNDLKGRPSLGPENAPVTIVEFSDYHCPFCQRLNATLKKILADYPQKVRLVWRHFPLAMHVGADRTHQAAECANEQEKFWAFHDKIFSSGKRSWTEADYESTAKEAGLDASKFKACMQNPDSKNKVDQDIAKGKSSGVRGTPAVFLNGVFMSGAQPYESYKAAIEKALSQPSKK